jgi:acetyl-CoA carboxylase biotin carboxylase subunit
VIEAMGDKIVAARHARPAGLPCLPASGAVHDADQAGAEAARIGYPVLLKAAAGGGGRGMRLVREAGAMAAAWASASAEAGAAFGDATLYVEKLIERAPTSRSSCWATAMALHLGERDCSAQRRHQKLLEEAPAPRLPDTTRQALAERPWRWAARSATRAQARSSSCSTRTAGCSIFSR